MVAKVISELKSQFLHLKFIQKLALMLRLSF